MMQLGGFKGSHVGYSEKLLDVHFASEPHDLVHLFGQFAVDECIVLAVNLQGPNLENSCEPCFRGQHDLHGLGLVMLQLR
jgi:hypothetical protein